MCVCGGGEGQHGVGFARVAKRSSPHSLFKVVTGRLCFRVRGHSLVPSYWPLLSTHGRVSRSCVCLGPLLASPSLRLNLITKPLSSWRSVEGASFASSLGPGTVTSGGKVASTISAPFPRSFAETGFDFGAKDTVLEILEILEITTYLIQDEGQLYRLDL